jgi:hypothetical protein
MALSCPQNRTTRRVGSKERLWFGKSITGVLPLLPINDNSNRDQDARRLKQTRFGSNNLLPHLVEKINLRGHPACDTTTDAEDIHGPFSLVHLIDY